MKVIFELDKFNKNKYRKPIVVAIGTFDGVHRAHKAIIKAAVDTANKINGYSMVLTFFPHPMKVVKPGQTPELLISIEHRIKLISELNPDICIVINFKKSFSQLTPFKFMNEILKERIGVSHIVVGKNFSFGRRKSGNVATLKRMSKKLRFKIKVMPFLKLKTKIMSSSYIRALVKKGRLKQAGRMLGREFTVLGTVAAGNKRGKILGYPTANIDPHQEALPPQGVYAVRLKLGKIWYHGMLNRGVRPTFYGKEKVPLVEVHIFNFHRNIYAKQIEIQFVKKIRNEIKFNSALELTKQLAKDKISILKILKTN